MSTTTKRPSIRIQPRDIKIFYWLYKLRFLTAHQIAGLVEAVEEKVANPNYRFRQGHDAVIKRINLLKKAGYLNHLTKPFQKYVYTLGPKAVDVLILEKGILREEIYHVLEQKKRSEKHLEHALMVAEFGATLALACKKRPDVKLIVWLPESNELEIETVIPESHITDVMQKWKKDGKLKLKKKPDAIFGLEDPKGKMFFMLEADRGTMTANRFLQKMVAYYYFLAQDQFYNWSLEKRIHPEVKPIKKFRVITYTVTPQWQRTLMNITLQATPGNRGSKMFWFTNQILVDSERAGTIFKPVFFIAQDNEIDKRHSVLE